MINANCSASRDFVAAVPSAYLWRGRRVEVHPISNSLPDALFVPHVPRKARGMAANVPGNASTYVFATEEGYLRHYRRALFGVTRKKTGWGATTPQPRCCSLPLLQPLATCCNRLPLLHALPLATPPYPCYTSTPLLQPLTPCYSPLPLLLPLAPATPPCSCYTPLLLLQPLILAGTPYPCSPPLPLLQPLTLATPP